MIVNFREAVSGITHLFAACLSIVGMIWLIIISHHQLDKLFIVAFYGITMTLLFLASARLHLSHGSPEYMLKLRRQDHASIYLVMAGTYTPMIYLLLTGVWRWGMLLIIWMFCSIGMYWKLKRLNGRSHISTIMYLCGGWFAIISAPQWVPRLPGGTIVLIVAGGIVYSIGALVFALEKPNLASHFGFHELWHLFVIAGSILHFFAMLQIVRLF